MKEDIKMLRYLLQTAVEHRFYNGLLFSGGLDTSILAYLNRKIVAITVTLESTSDDIPYAMFLTKYLNLKHYHRKVEIDEAIESIPEVIKILKSFDPALPNDLVVYFGLAYAKDLGLETIATGDGSDELFGGYSFMQKLDDLESYIRRISKKMSFSSNDIGEFFGIKIIQPFIEKNCLDYALTLPPDLKIRKDKGELWGKWILRQAFEDLLPKEIVWQKKRPLEFGSGMTRLRQIISSKISDEEFKENTFPIQFMNKEHYYYYKIFREVIGEIPQPANGETNCPGCRAGIKQDSFHCGICGYTGR